MENSGFFKKSTEELAAYMTELPETSYFIFAEEDVDKRGKMYKAGQKTRQRGRIQASDGCCADAMDPWNIKKENKKITRSVMELF